MNEIMSSQARHALLHQLTLALTVPISAPSIELTNWALFSLNQLHQYNTDHHLGLGRVYKHRSGANYGQTQSKTLHQVQKPVFATHMVQIIEIRFKKV